MSNYTQSTNFATKDALVSGNALKIVKGTEINTEYANIAIAVATKADLTSPVLITPNIGTPSAGVLTSCTGLPMTTGVTGTLPVANGGTGVTSSTGTGSTVLSASPTFTGTATIPIANISGGNITGITDLTVLDGGTGSSTAAGARTNLGLAIGTNVQAWDADLDTWASKTAPSGTVVGTSDTQTLTNKTINGSQLVASSVAFAALLSTDWSNSIIHNGYQKLPSGLYIQWGAFNLATPSTTVNFPIAFPSACFCVVGIAKGASAPSLNNVMVFNVVSASQFAGYASATQDVYYIAIGG